MVLRRVDPVRPATSLTFLSHPATEWGTFDPGLYKSCGSPRPSVACVPVVNSPLGSCDHIRVRDVGLLRSSSDDRDNGSAAARARRSRPAELGGKPRAYNRRYGR